MPGPLPTKNPRRRNAPTIPTTKLPAAGRDGDAPDCPYAIGAAGAAWWEWAWQTPHAAAWSAGDLYLIARRASFEDDLAALADVAGLDLLELLEADNVRAVVTKVAALATGKLQITKEMREIDDRLGLTPKGMAALRWEIAPDEVGEKRTDTVDAGRRRLKVVDPSAVAGA